MCLSALIAERVRAKYPGGRTKAGRHGVNPKLLIGQQSGLVQVSNLGITRFVLVHNVGKLGRRDKLNGRILTARVAKVHGENVKDVVFQTLVGAIDLATNYQIQDRTGKRPEIDGLPSARQIFLAQDLIESLGRLIDLFECSHVRRVDGADFTKCGINHPISSYVTVSGTSGCHVYASPTV